MILLSFDTEEFDVPREHGVEFSLAQGMEVSIEGTNRILDCLKANKVKATFFCTGNFAQNAPEIMKRIIDEGHEVACHGVDHFSPQETDLERSKEIVEKIAKIKVQGYRQPRMQKIDYKELRRCGDKYESSRNPAYIPGRYDNRKVPRRPFVKGGILEIPTSVATRMRVPMFWLALHLFPKKIYYKMAKMTVKSDGYFATYFHPWEFANLAEYSAVPGYIKHNSGMKMAGRLEGLICEMLKNGYSCITYGECYEIWKKTRKKEK